MIFKKSKWTILRKELNDELFNKRIEVERIDHRNNKDVAFHFIYNNRRFIVDRTIYTFHDKIPTKIYYTICIGSIEYGHIKYDISRYMKGIKRMFNRLEKQYQAENKIKLYNKIERFVFNVKKP